MQVKETVIRRMTRLAADHGAVNLAQGFTDETPAYDMWSGVAALLGGTGEGARRVESLTVREILRTTGNADADALDLPVKELSEQVRGSRDEFNQCSFPFGLPELRHAIADYTQSYYGYRPDPEEQITVVLGASEGMAAAFRSLLDPGRRRGGDAALSRAVPVAGGDLRAGAPLRDPARGSPRRNVAAGPRRVARRPV